MINFAILKRLGWRLITGRKGHEDLCNKQWILCPGGSPE